MSVLTGGCSCGRLAYTIRGSITDGLYCHCAICRKLTGSAFAAYGTVQQREFFWVEDNRPARTYSPTPDTTRYFCGDCGGFVLSEHVAEPDEYYVSLGTLNDSEGITMSYHQFMASSPEWCQLNDSLPYFDGWPENNSEEDTR